MSCLFCHLVCPTHQALSLAGLLWYSLMISWLTDVPIHIILERWRGLRRGKYVSQCKSCNFVIDWVVFLAYVVLTNGISIGDDKVKAV